MHFIRLLVALLLLLQLPALAGTGGAEGPEGAGKDVDHELRAAVRWIFKLDGLKVVRSQRTEDFNEYSIDQSKSDRQLMDTIIQGLNKRKWSINPKTARDNQEVIRARKGNKEVTVSLKKTGAEPRLLVEVVEVPSE